MTHNQSHRRDHGIARDGDGRDSSRLAHYRPAAGRQMTDRTSTENGDVPEPRRPQTVQHLVPVSSTRRSGTFQIWVHRASGRRSSGIGWLMWLVSTCGHGGAARRAISARPGQSGASCTQRANSQSLVRSGSSPASWAIRLVSLTGSDRSRPGQLSMCWSTS
jgi:hypothetical protein